MVNSFILYNDIGEHLRLLTDEEAGTVFKAVVLYSLTGEVIELESGGAKMLFSVIRQKMDLNTEKYIKVLEERRKAGQKGGEAKARNLANATNSKQTLANAINSKQSLHDTVTDTVTEICSNQRLEGYKVDNQRLSCENSYKFPPLKLQDYDFTNVKNLWNETCSGFRSVLKMTSKNSNGKRGGRKQKVRNRLNEIKELSENGTKEEAFEILKSIFQKMQKNSFLKGDSKDGWKADFDWLFRDSNNWLKVYEGVYDNNKVGNVKNGSNSNVNDIWEAEERNYDEQF